jgi:amino acid transporter
MSLEGFAPRFFSKTSQRGTPLNNLAFVIALCCLTFMTASKGASTVFGWFISLSAVGLMTNYFFIMISYMFWSRALKAQGFDRSRLPCEYFVPVTW